MTSNNAQICPLNECDGQGYTLYENNVTRVIRKEICRCSAIREMERKLSFANMPKEFKELTVKSFDTSLYTEENKPIAMTAKKVVINYIHNFDKFKELGKGLYLYSNTKGSGKTRLAVSLINALMFNKKQFTRFMTCSELLGQIKSSYNPNSQVTEEEIMNAIMKVDVLVIDDIGTERPTGWVSEMLFNIIDRRMKFNKVTVFTSNCMIEELQHDDRIKSRIGRMCIPIKMPEQDIRLQLAKNENDELYSLLMKGGK